MPIPQCSMHIQKESSSCLILGLNSEEVGNGAGLRACGHRKDLGLSSLELDYCFLPVQPVAWLTDNGPQHIHHGPVNLHRGGARWTFSLSSRRKGRRIRRGAFQCKEDVES